MGRPHKPTPGEEEEQLEFLRQQQYDEQLSRELEEMEREHTHEEDGWQTH
jgi:hypothetical protein